MDAQLQTPTYSAVQGANQYFDYRAYLETLFEPEDHIFIQLVHSTKTHKDERGNNVKDTRLLPLLQRAALVAEKAYRRLLELQNEGWNVYVSMNPFPAGTQRRWEASVQTIRNLYIESDNEKDTLALITAANEEAFVPTPHSVLESSPGKYHVVWSVKDFAPQTAKPMLKSLAARFGGDPQATDLHRVLRMPGFRNLKYPSKPETKLLEQRFGEERNSPADFNLPVEVMKPHAAAISSEKLAGIIDRFYKNAELAGLELGYEHEHAGGVKWIIECPWADEHTTVGSTAALFVMSDGSIQFNCFHAHCAARGWSDVRKIMEIKVGYKLPFTDNPITTLIDGKPPCSTVSQTIIKIDESASPAVKAAAMTSAKIVEVEAHTDRGEDLIPPFDPSITANSLYGEFVEVATQGTNLVPQFVYSIAKNIIATKLSGSMKFETVDADPRQYLTLIGSTGTGKGEAWRRVCKVLEARPSTEVGSSDEAAGMMRRLCGIKVLDSFDSSAGLKDAFFAAPESAPILSYIDEVIGFGNKGRDSKNPDILDVFIELADSTTVSRVIAKRDGGGAKTKGNARLSVVMCAQDGDSITKAFASRAKMGLYDRLVPEHAMPVDNPGNLPAIDQDRAIALLSKVMLLDYSGEMTMTSEAKDFLNIYWSNLLPQIRKVARWKKGLAVDAYLVAFGRGSRVVDVSDIEIAVKTFTRQLVMRYVFFTADVPDRIGLYIQRIKAITESMKLRLAAGEEPTKVAQGRRDYERKTHAHRDNETHIFERAWQVHRPHWLVSFGITRANGQVYDKFLPKPEDPDSPSD